MAGFAAMSLGGVGCGRSVERDSGGGLETASAASIDTYDAEMDPSFAGDPGYFDGSPLTPPVIQVDASRSVRVSVSLPPNRRDRSSGPRTAGPSPELRFQLAAAPIDAEVVPRPSPAVPAPAGAVEWVPTPVGRQSDASEAPRIAAAPTPAAAPTNNLDPASPPQPPAAGGPDVTTPTEAPKSGRDIVATNEGDPIVNPLSDSIASDHPSTVDPVDDVSDPASFEHWSPPELTLVVTGNQHGYIEPCGCTGLDKQKGGMARRFTFLDQLRRRGWTVAPIDAGNQVRRFGAQAEIKLQKTVDALSSMNYRAVGIGPDDVRLGIGPMLAVAAEGSDATFCSANVVLFDESMMPAVRTFDAGGFRIGVTSFLDPSEVEDPDGGEIVVNDPAGSLPRVTRAWAEQPVDFRVAMFYGDEEAAADLMRAAGDAGGFDLCVVAGGYGEPTYRPIEIDGVATRMIVTGNKGMYAGLIGLTRGEPMRYARAPLTHRYEDAPEMRELMADYQTQLRQVGLDGLGLLPPSPHSSGDRFVGSAKCGECHTSAMEVWENSMHAEATAHLVEPPAERSDVARHFDPECLSCHVTGWNPQDYYPYETGYLSLEQSAHLTGNGCENCHGPGAAHSAAEAEGSTVAVAERDALRIDMRLPLERAREKCMECHDLDNSPDFHEPDAFEDVYWPEVEHYGVD